FKGTKPDTPFAILKNTDDDVTADAPRVIERKAEDFELICSWLPEVQSIFGSHPQVSAAIGKDGPDQVRTEVILPCFASTVALKLYVRTRCIIYKTATISAYPLFTLIIFRNGIDVIILNRMRNLSLMMDVPERCCHFLQQVKPPRIRTYPEV